VIGYLRASASVAKSCRKPAASSAPARSRATGSPYSGSRRSETMVNAAHHSPQNTKQARIAPASDSPNSPRAWISPMFRARHSPPPR
jgi:hypothetical protein